MNIAHKFLITSLLVFSMVFSNTLQAGCCSDNTGCGYEDSRRASSMAPGISLGCVALVILVAFALLKTTDEGGNCHHY
ncbi:MAG: hypothetical protein AAGG81_05180 [Chlamydiota bacterium]